MAKIFLIRHAESIANTEGIYQGQSYDTSLSTLGEMQARALSDRFLTTEFDSIFTSPVKRTTQTAQAISEEITFAPEILETNHGEWEGLSIEEIKKRWPKMYALWKSNPSKVVFPHGEAFTQTAKRSINWVDALLKQSGIFIVITHSNIIMALLTHFLKMPLDDIWSFDIQPTSVSLVESISDSSKVTYSNWLKEPINRATQSVVRYNDTSHLIGLESDLNIHAL